MSRVFIAILFIELSSCIIAKKPNTNVESKPKYCFQVMSMGVYLSLFGPTRVFFHSAWYDEYCNGTCRQDSLVIAYQKKGTYYYDTVATPNVNNEGYVPDYSKPISVWMKENKSLIDKYPVLLNDTMLFKGFINYEPVYIPINK